MGVRLVLIVVTRNVPKEGVGMKGFFAYAAMPPQIAETIRLAIEDVERFHAVTSIVDWSELDIDGRLIATEVLREIDQSDFLVADITSMNFNVTYEVGYAIGRGKSVLERSEERREGKEWF